MYDAIRYFFFRVKRSRSERYCENLALVVTVPLQTIWRWPESRRIYYQPLSFKIKGRLGNEYRSDTGTSASDKDGLAKQSGCVEDGH
jgi:hypothetical protein